MKKEKGRIRKLLLVLQKAGRTKTAFQKSNGGTSWPWFIIVSQLTTYHGSFGTYLSKWPHRCPTTCPSFLRMANVPSRMNKNMEPRQTGKTLCLCSPAVASVETGTKKTAGHCRQPIHHGDLRWQQSQKWWDPVLFPNLKKTSRLRILPPGPNCTICSSLWLFYMMEGLVSAYIIPPPMPPVRRYMKNKNIYTSKQKKCKNIRRRKYSSTPRTTLNPSQFKLGYGETVILVERSIKIDF